MIRSLPRQPWKSALRMHLEQPHTHLGEVALHCARQNHSWPSHLAVMDQGWAWKIRCHNLVATSHNHQRCSFFAWPYWVLPPLHQRLLQDMQAIDVFALEGIGVCIQTKVCEKLWDTQGVSFFSTSYIGPQLELAFWDYDRCLCKGSGSRIWLMQRWEANSNTLCQPNA